MMQIQEQAVNALRILSIDQVQAAQSGHPGLPLGAAPIIYELFANHMKHHPKNPKWVNRDRFVLSAGHGSALLYSALHLFGYGVELEDLKAFRQYGSKTPGHPEYGHTLGVEATTGPLGAGIAMGVGMAMAQKHLASIFNREGYPILDHYTYVLHGDGCLNEGISAEALSLAGTLQLDKLILLYDSNEITIEGKTTIAFQEDVAKRMEAYGFQVLQVMDGNDVQAIAAAITKAKADTTRPSFIEIKTKIGFGSPVEDQAKAHGEPLGVAGVEATRNALGWESSTPFEIPKIVLNHYQIFEERFRDQEQTWNALFEQYLQAHPSMEKTWNRYFGEDETLLAYLESDAYWSMEAKLDATRNISGRILNDLARVVPNFFGGSADLAPSNKSRIHQEGDFFAYSPNGSNLHFGVREHAMAGIVNGISLHGGLRPYGATFLVFSDFMKPMLRLASLMQCPNFMIFTHDSIGVGEDGPTHQPIEQLAMLRAQPNYDVFRPADTVECLAAYAHALRQQHTPTGLVFTRQNVPVLTQTSKEALKGGYIVVDDEQAQGIFIASGSELHLAIEAAHRLKEEGIFVRVVSMPCMELFERQPKSYRDAILPLHLKARVAIEAGTSLPWYRYVGLEGTTLCMDHFGASGKAEVLYEAYGLHVENAIKKMKELL